jgi:hypothetical protein
MMKLHIKELLFKSSGFHEDSADTAEINALIVNEHGESVTNIINELEQDLKASQLKYRRLVDLIKEKGELFKEWGGCQHNVNSVLKDHRDREETYRQRRSARSAK